MSVRVSERSVRNHAGDVRVRATNTGNVEVEWFCGDDRRFSPAAIKEVLEHVKAMDTHPDAWLKITDVRGERVYLRRDGDVLYANTAPHSAYEFVSWSDLRKAIKATVKDLKG